MAAIEDTVSQRDTGSAYTAPDRAVGGEQRAYQARHVLAITRIAIGWVFLWAFLDKTFGLGFATERADAWVNGGSPTSGYLNFATEGKTFHDFFASVASPAADWLFMIGLLGIGLALILGIGMWIAAISGSVMLVLMWAAALPLENNPFMDGHIIYALVLVALAIYGAGRTWTRAYLGGTPHRPQAAHPQVTRTHAPRAGGRNSAAGRLGTAVLVPPSSYRRAHPAARLSNERASVCLHT